MKVFFYYTDNAITTLILVLSISVSMYEWIVSSIYIQDKIISSSQDEFFWDCLLMGESFLPLSTSYLRMSYNNENWHSYVWGRTL